YRLVYCASNDRIYVTMANDGTSTVAVIIPSTNLVETLIEVAGNPENIVYCPSNNRIYTCASWTNLIAVIDPSTNTVETTITPAGLHNAMAYSSSNDRIYIADDLGIVTVLDPSVNTVEMTIDLGGDGGDFNSIIYRYFLEIE
ncbi:MAG: 6-phosphogluconolactonase, partial [Deltaproteobacteria bacterium]|nr:6-phosphogluconolactonase [Deltaproteobacteria bacterium]